MVGERIRTIRKLRGYTQEKLGESTGLQASYISDVEQGNRNISLETIEKIALALEVEPVDLFKFYYGDKAKEKEELLDTLMIYLKNRSLSEIEAIQKVINEVLNIRDLPKEKN
jgi:transcriptional regulator with XRE-family HTH domain